MSAKTRWQVGGCVIRPATNEVERDGASIHLEPRSMEVLVHLIENAGNIVSRDRLQGAIWGNVVVGDESLTNAIIKIRKALGDDARNPHFVETIPKRGYRLIAPVEPLADAKAGDPGGAGGGRGLRRGLLWAGLVVAAVLVVFVSRGPNDPARAVSGPARPTSSAAGARIMVKPFVNLGGDGGRDYLARGLEEMVVNQISRKPGLSVIHPSAAADVASDFVLEGMVFPGPDALRVTIRLIDAANGTILANEQLEQPFAELLDMERAIEARIITALALDIEQADLTRRASGYTDSTRAFDLFLQGQAALLTRSADANRRAQDFYRQAIAHDPRFARAYGGLALSLAAEYRNGWAAEPKAALAEALEMAQTALQIAPDLPEQYWVIGYVRTQQRDFTAARTALYKALKLRADYADAHALLGGIATYTGAPQDSIAFLRRAIQLRPQAGYLYYLLLGRAYYFLGNCEQAEINLAEAIARNPSNTEARLYYAACLLRQGKRDESEWEIVEVETLEPGFTLAGFLHSYPLVDSSQIQQLTRDLRQIGVR